MRAVNTYFLLLAVIFSDWFCYSGGEKVMKKVGVWIDTYHVRKFNIYSHNKDLHDPCHQYNETLAWMNTEIYKKLNDTIRTQNQEGDLIWVKGIEDSCQFYAFINGTQASGVTNDTAHRHTVDALDDECMDGDNLSPSSHMNSVVGLARAVFSLDSPCMLLNISSGKPFMRNCSELQRRRRTIQALCHRREQISKLWLPVAIGVGGFIFGIIISGIFFYCACRRKQESTQPLKSVFRKQTGEDESGAYAEILEIANYDNLSQKSSSKRKPEGEYDKPRQIPYTQPVDVISETKGDYAEPYQHLGAIGKSSSRPSSNESENYKFNSSRSRGGYNIRAPEVPPPDIPREGKYTKLNDDFITGEYADPIETCHIKQKEQKGDSLTATKMNGKTNYLNKFIAVPAVDNRTSTSVVENDLYN